MRAAIAGRSASTGTTTAAVLPTGAPPLTVALAPTATAALWRLLYGTSTQMKLHRRCVVIVMLRIDGDGLLDQLLHLTQQSHFFFRTKADRVATGTGTGRPPDPVDVGIRFRRQIKVDDQSDVFHVDATGGDIGRHEHLNVAALIPLKRFLTCGLRLVAVYRVRTEASLLQLPGRFFAPCLVRVKMRLN